MTWRPRIGARSRPRGVPPPPTMRSMFRCLNYIPVRQTSITQDTRPCVALDCTSGLLKRSLSLCIASRSSGRALAIGCVRSVRHTRRSGSGSVAEVELRLHIAPGCPAGTEFVFSAMGNADGVEAAGDVVCVIREAAHPQLVRQGDELVFISSKEVMVEELLLFLEVRWLPGPAHLKSRLSQLTAWLMVAFEGTHARGLRRVRHRPQPGASSHRRVRSVPASSSRTGYGQCRRPAIARRGVGFV